MGELYGYCFLENDKKDIIVKFGNKWNFREFSQDAARTTFKTEKEAQDAIGEMKSQGLYVDDVKVKTIIYKVGTIKNLDMDCKERFIFKYDIDGLSDQKQLEMFLDEKAFCDSFKVISCRNVTKKEFEILDKVLSFPNMQMEEAGKLTLALAEML